MTENELQSLLGSLSKSVRDGVDERMESNLRAAFRSRQRRFRGYLLEAAASVAVAVGLYFLLSPAREANREPAANHDLFGGSEFVLLPYGQSDVPLEQPVIVRVQVPASELSGWGVPLPPFRGGNRVEADLLVGQDGIARAVRVNRQVKP